MVFKKILIVLFFGFTHAMAPIISFLDSCCECSLIINSDSQDNIDEQEIKDFEQYQSQTQNISDSSQIYKFRAQDCEDDGDISRFRKNFGLAKRYYNDASLCYKIFGDNQSATRCKKLAFSMSWLALLENSVTAKYALKEKSKAASDCEDAIRWMYSIKNTPVNSKDKVLEPLKSKYQAAIANAKKLFSESKMFQKDDSMQIMLLAASYKYKNAAAIYAEVCNHLLGSGGEIFFEIDLEE